MTAFDHSLHGRFIQLSSGFGPVLARMLPNGRSALASAFEGQERTRYARFEIVAF
jgi:hypothetical protein